MKNSNLRLTSLILLFLTFSPVPVWAQTHTVQQIQSRTCASSIAVEAAKELPHEQAQLFKQGHRLVCRDQIEAATSVYRQLVQKQQGVSDLLEWQESYIYLHLADALFNDNRSKEAIAAMHQAIAINENDPELYLKLGYIQTHINDRKAALETFQRVFQLMQPGNKDQKFADSWTYHHFGNALIEQGRFSEAIKARKKSVKLQPDILRWQMELGDAYGLAGKTQTALKYYKTVNSQSQFWQLDWTGKPIKNLRVPGYLRLGRTLSKAKQYDRAIQAYEQAAQLAPDLSIIQGEMGKVWANQGSLDLAKQAFCKEIQLQGEGTNARATCEKNPQIYLNLGDAVDSRDDAIAAYQIAVALAPKNTDANWRLGQELFKARHYETAIPFLKGGLNNSFRDSHIYIDLIFAYKALKHYEDAALVYEDWIRKEPSYLNWSGYADILVFQNRLDDAFQAFREMTLIAQPVSFNVTDAEGNPSTVYKSTELQTTSPQNIDATSYFLFGQGLSSHKHYEKAIAAFEQTLIYDPNDPKAYYEIALNHEKLNQLSLALEAVDASLKLNPDNQDALQLKGVIQDRLPQSVPQKGQ